MTFLFDSNAPTLFIGQMNPVVGAIPPNAEKILTLARQAAAEGADLLILPEMAVCGYPAEDLWLSPDFITACMEACAQIAKQAPAGMALLFGSPWRENGQCYNTALLVENGAITHRHFKHILPHEGVFDEKRVFEAGPLPKPLTWRGHKLGILICEELWHDKTLHNLHEADLLICLNASPFTTEKAFKRQHHGTHAVQQTGAPLLYANLVGTQDGLVFDGRSFVMDAGGNLTQQGPLGEESVQKVEAKSGAASLPKAPASEAEDHGLIYSLLMLGLKDYVLKNGFSSVLLGLSGGIDSAFVAALAVDALGPKQVRTIMLPSRYTSISSLEDAESCAKLLSLKLEQLPIEGPVDALESLLAPHVDGVVEGLTAENMQARLRGVLLMALSNASGAMLLTTGNKSEIAVGYATLYGDMCGGYNPIKDVYKTDLYALARWRNAHTPPHAKGPDGSVMPEAILTKAPTAELRPDQKDEDSLPPYPELDVVLKRLIEADEGIEKIVADGWDATMVQHVAHLLLRAEYKRRQSAPGTIISSRPFGRDRRYPMTNHYKG